MIVFSSKPGYLSSKSVMYANPKELGSSARPTKTHLVTCGILTAITHHQSRQRPKHVTVVVTQFWYDKLRFFELDLGATSVDRKTVQHWKFRFKKQKVYDVMISVDYEQSPFFLRDSRASKMRACMKSPHARKARHGASPLRLTFLAWGDFHARSRFAHSTIPEEKWGLLVVYDFRIQSFSSPFCFPLILSFKV